MAPKKEAPTLVLDNNPYGAFVNVSVERASLQLEHPGSSELPSSARGGKSPVPTGPPHVHVVVSYPPSSALGELAPLVGKAEAPDVHEDSHHYDLSFISRFRREPSMDGLHELLNGVLRFALHEATSNVPLAYATLDMISFGLGESSVQLNTLQLQADPATPEGHPKVLGGSLNGVRVWLTHRPNPAPATDAPGAPPSPTPASPPPAGSRGQSPAASRPSTSASGTRPRSGRGAVEEVNEADLPEPQPFSFVPPELREGANVVEVAVTALGPLPPALPAVVTATQESKTGGKVAFTLGLDIPGGPPVLLPGGTMSSTSGTGSTPTPGDGHQVVFAPSRNRQFVAAAQAKALLYQLEDGVPLKLELARYLASETTADVAWDTYHAAADVAGDGVTALAQAGATEGEAVTVSFAAFAPGSSSILPKYAAPQGKGIKVMEEPAAAAAAGGSSGCAWQEAGTQVTVTLKCARPLVAPWRPPPPPPQPLQALLQQPAAAKKSAGKSKHEAAASEEFKQQVGLMVRGLMQLQLSSQQQQADAPLQPQASVASSGLASAASLQQLPQAQAAAALQPGLPFEEQLERAGFRRQLLEQLRAAAVQVVMQRHRRPLGCKELGGAERAEVMQQVFAHLEQLLQQAARGVLQDGAAATTAAAATGGDAEGCLDQQTDGEQQQQQLARLAALASECEVQGSLERAEAVHQRRVLLALESADAWAAYGQLCMRWGGSGQKLGRAEECLRRALELQPAHAGALAALSALLLHQGSVTDPLHLTAAADAARALVASQQQQQAQAGAPGEPPLGAALLLLVTQAQGDAARADDVAGALAALQAAEAAALQAVDGEGAEGEVPSPQQANGLLAAAQLAVSLHLPVLALTASNQAAVELPDSCQLAAVAYELELVRAEALLLEALGEVQAAKDAKAAAQKAADVAAAAREAHRQLKEQRQQQLAAAGQQAGDDDDEAHLPGVIPSAVVHNAVVAANEAAAAAATAGSARDAAARQLDSGCSSVLSALEAARSCRPPADPRADVIEGRLHFAQGEWKEAARAYNAALAAAGIGSSGAGAPPAAAAAAAGALPLYVFLQLGQAYVELGHPAYALDVYMQACAHQPCASAWLGLARCLAATSDAAGAESALSEANGLDPEHPGVWAELASAAVRASRTEEAAAALSCALRFGLTDTRALVELGKQFSAADMPLQAQSCLEVAARLEPASFTTQLALARCLTEAGDAVSARRHLDEAARLAQSPEQAQQVHELVPRLLDLLLH